MQWRIDRVGLAVAALVVTTGLISVGSVQGAGATTHPTYPLGKAKSCKAHYVKRTEHHKIKGKEVRYVACVYVAPKAPVPTSTTTTTTTTIPAIPTFPSGTDVITYPTVMENVQSNRTFSGGVYSVIEQAGADIPVQPDGFGGFAQGGIVRFTDANGVLLCSVEVAAEGVAVCAANTSSQPPGPITATYSGSYIYFNGTAGVWVYEPSSGTGPSN